jgi:hypothetical protein
MGHERRFRDAWVMSAYPPIADMRADIALRRSGPGADYAATLTQDIRNLANNSFEQNGARSG